MFPQKSGIPAFIVSKTLVSGFPRGPDQRLIRSRSLSQKPGRTDGRHRAAGGSVVRTTAIQSSSGSSPEIRFASALVTGASIPASVIARASSGTESNSSIA